MTPGSGRASRAAGAAAALWMACDGASAATPEFVPELTAYYAGLGLYVPLTGKPIPDLHGDDELAIYRALLLNALRPQVLLLEASTYPMPVLGTWLRRNQPGFYGDAALRGDFNWIESVTAGFPEPAALSLFLGSAVNLVRPGEQRKGSNKGHVGTLASYGDRHIRRNVLVDDHWYELEWKLKGERDFADDRLSWSFRVGTKQHAHPDVADTAYVGLRRGNLDWRAPALAWLTNSSAEVWLALTTDDPALARAELLVEKRYPLARWGVALALETGFLYEARRAYSGALADAEDDFIFALRPNLEF